MSRPKFDSLKLTADYSPEATIKIHTAQAAEGQIRHGDSNVSSTPEAQGIGNDKAIQLARARLLETQLTGSTTISESSITDMPTLPPEEILATMREKMKMAMEAQRNNN
jgi:hypothetical protein